MEHTLRRPRLTEEGSQGDPEEGADPKAIGDGDDGVDGRAPDEDPPSLQPLPGLEGTGEERWVVPAGEQLPRPNEQDQDGDPRQIVQDPLPARLGGELGGLDGGKLLGGNLGNCGVVVRLGSHGLPGARYSSACKLYFSSTFRSTYSAET